ncbi:hypothetical protein ACFV3E_43565 [Streptomyces sp. NPDC059718]
MVLPTRRFGFFSRLVGRRRHAGVGSRHQVGQVDVVKVLPVIRQLQIRPSLPQLRDQALLALEDLPPEVVEPGPLHRPNVYHLHVLGGMEPLQACRRVQAQGTAYYGFRYEVPDPQGVEAAGEDVEGGVAVGVADDDEVVGGFGQGMQRPPDGRVAQHVGVDGQDTPGGILRQRGGVLGSQHRAGDGGLQLGDRCGDLVVEHR